MLKHRHKMIVLLLPVLATTSGLRYLEADEFPATKKFGKAATLEDAIVIMRQKLRLDGKSEYAALLSEARIRAAINTAIKSYELNAMAQSERRFPGTKEHFESDVKPVMLKLAKDGIWPEGCSMDAYYRLTEQRDGAEISYDGIGLSIQIETPEAKFKGFSLPILVLFFGRVEREAN